MTLVFSDPLQGQDPKVITCEEVIVATKARWYPQILIDGLVVAHRQADGVWSTEFGLYRKVGIRMEAA